MLSSLRSIGNGLLVAGLLGLFVGYGSAVVSCPTCLPASVFSVYGTAGDPGDPFLPGASISSLSSDSSHTTVPAHEGTVSLLFATIQATSIYLLLLAAVILIVLELAELKYLRALYRDRTKRGRFQWFTR